MIMKICHIILILLSSTLVVQAQNILDVLPLSPNIDVEQKIWENFKKLSCYKEGTNYQIQPVYALSLKHSKGVHTKSLEYSILTNESLFIEDLYISGYTISQIKCNKILIDDVFYYNIYNDSLQPIGSYSYTAFCNYNSSSYDNSELYAMENQYIIFGVSGILANIMFGYKDGKLYIFETELKPDGKFHIYPFEEFDWNKPSLAQWRELSVKKEEVNNGRKKKKN